MSSLALVWSLPIGGAHPRSTDPASLKATLFDACGCSTKSWMSRFLTPSLLAAQDHSNRAAHIDMLWLRRSIEPLLSMKEVCPTQCAAKDFDGAVAGTPAIRQSIDRVSLSWQSCRFLILS